jgi:hypothetical protein
VHLHWYAGDIILAVPSGRSELPYRVRSLFPVPLRIFLILPFYFCLFTSLQSAFALKRCPFAPQQIAFAPKKNHFAPKQNHFASKKNHFSPKKNHFAPKKNHFAPKKNASAPKKNASAAQQNHFALENNRVLRHPDAANPPVIKYFQPTASF